MKRPPSTYVDPSDAYDPRTAMQVRRFMAQLDDEDPLAMPREKPDDPWPPQRVD